MPDNENKEVKGKIIISILVIVVIGISMFWVLSKRDAPALDTKAAKRMIAHFEKICRTTREVKECRKIIGEGHAACFLSSASKSDSGEVVYDRKIYMNCLEK